MAVKPVENGGVDEVEIVNVTSIDMSPDAPRLTNRCQSRLSSKTDHVRLPRGIS